MFVTNSYASQVTVPHATTKTRSWRQERLVPLVTFDLAGTSVTGLGATTHPEAPPEELVKRLFARISEVSTLPAVAMRIIQVANDSTTGAADLLEAVGVRHSHGRARIMRTVNSSYYSMQNKVADLKLAITLLGFKEIRNLAMTAYVAQLFKKGTGHGTYTREGLWNHMIGVGIVARLIAEGQPEGQPHAKPIWPACFTTSASSSSISISTNPSIN